MRGEGTLEGGGGEECVETKIGFHESSVPSTKIENKTKRCKNCVAQTGLTSSSVSGYTDPHTEMLTCKEGGLVARFFLDCQDHVCFMKQIFNNAA